MADPKKSSPFVSALRKAAKVTAQGPGQSGSFSSSDNPQPGENAMAPQGNDALHAKGDQIVPNDAWAGNYAADSRLFLQLHQIAIDSGQPMAKRLQALHEMDEGMGVESPYPTEDDLKNYLAESGEDEYPESFHTAQKDDRKKGDRPEQDQVVVDGSPTAKADHEMKFFVEADDEEGSTRSPLYWAMEIARAIRSYPGGDSDAAYDNIITKAKASGLTKGQQDQINQLLIRWQVSVKVDGEAAAEKAQYGGGASDQLNFNEHSQKQVAASVHFPAQRIAARLQGQTDAKTAAGEFLKDADVYLANRKAIRRKVLSQLLDQRISRLIKQFSREEIGRDMTNWNFPAEFKVAALKRLVPKIEPVTLAGPRIALSNGIPAERAKRKAAAESQIAQAADQTHLTKEQRLRLSSLKGKYPVDSPFWVVKAQWNEPRQMGDPNALAEILTERGYTITGQDPSGVQLKSADGSHTVRITGSTISFTSTADPSIDFSFGSNPRDLRAFLDRLPSFKARKPEATPTQTEEGGAPPEKEKSSLSVIRELMGGGMDDKAILDKLCELYPHRKRQNLRGVVWLARNKMKLGGSAPAEGGEEKQASKATTVYARLKDGRVLTAQIEQNGEVVIKTGFDPELKKAVRRWDGLQAGWVAFMEKKGQRKVYKGFHYEILSDPTGYYEYITGGGIFSKGEATRTPAEAEASAKKTIDELTSEPEEE